MPKLVIRGTEAWREGKQWEIGTGRWIITSEWIIIYCGVHSTVLSSPRSPPPCSTASHKQSHQVLPEGRSLP